MLVQLYIYQYLRNETTIRNKYCAIMIVMLYNLSKILSIWSFSSSNLDSAGPWYLEIIFFDLTQFFYATFKWMQINQTYWSFTGYLLGASCFSWTWLDQVKNKKVYKYLKATHTVLFKTYWRFRLLLNAQKIWFI